MIGINQIGNIPESLNQNTLASSFDKLISQSATNAWICIMTLEDASSEVSREAVVFPGVANIHDCNIKGRNTSHRY